MKLMLISTLLLLMVRVMQAQDAPKIEGNLAYVGDGSPSHMLDVYLPPGGRGPYPTLLVIHGGGWQFGEKGQMYNFALTYASKGYAVVSMNYRLVPEALSPAQLQDSFCALAWVYASAGTYNFDPNRVVVIGESAGGYLATMVGAVDDPATYLVGCPYGLGGRPRGIVAYYPVVGAIVDNNYPMAVTLSMYDFLGVNVGQIDLLAQAWANVSPLYRINGNEPPFLIIHAQNDPVVPSGDSQVLAATLTNVGVPASLYVLPGSSAHGFIADLNTQEALLAMGAVDQFLQAVDG